MERYPGEIIRILRKGRKWSVNKLATESESDVATISRLERNLQGFTSDTLKKIAIALECNMHEFFQFHKYINNGKEEKSSPTKPIPLHRRENETNPLFVRSSELLTQIFNLKDDKLIDHLLSMLEFCSERGIPHQSKFQQESTRRRERKKAI